MGLGNPDLKWQQTAQSNFALEAGFLKGRITARLEYFFKTTKNALTDISLAPLVQYLKIWEQLKIEAWNGWFHLFPTGIMSGLHIGL